jgi:hypothetical protein
LLAIGTIALLIKDDEVIIDLQAIAIGQHEGIRVLFALELASSA